MSQNKFNLEERTLKFAKNIIYLCKTINRNIINMKLIDQIIRSSGSIGANYLEANDSLGKKDFLHRLRIARKEAKETKYWIELILEANIDKKEIIMPLFNEVIEIKNILSAIINKIEKF